MTYASSYCRGAEGDEESQYFPSSRGKPNAEILRFAQNDKFGYCHSEEVAAAADEESQHLILLNAHEWIAGKTRVSMKTYCVYIMAGKFRSLYTGITGNLERRVLQHQRHLIPGFTSKYNLNRLVYFELFGDVRMAIQREKQIKGWLRTKKVALIVAHNPTWKDLSQDWFSKVQCESAVRRAKC